MKECDIVVVGAGPGGVSSAFFSKLYDKENNKEVLLLERLPEGKYSTYHHICGECIDKDAFKEISPIEPSHIIEEINTVKEFVVDEFVIENELKGYILDRPKFLSNIIKKFQKMGGNFRRETVIDISRNNGKIKLKTDQGNSFKGKYLIGADGANSQIRKKFNFDDIKTTLARQYIVDKEPDHETLKIFYDEKYEGDYKWEFPNGNNTKIGFPYIKNKNFDVEGEILKKQSRLIGHGDIKSRIDKNILLVGDAAGQTNSLSKGGFRAAMFAGKKAAESVIKHGNPEKYESAWKESIFHSKLTEKAFNRIKKMDNEEIIEHLKPFKSRDIIAFLKIIFFKKYWKYIDLYKAYMKEQEMGW